MVAFLPVFVLLAKMAGLYDRDQYVLHKTTLDEAPALVGVAAIFALFDRGRAGDPVHGPVPAAAALGDADRRR